MTIRPATRALLETYDRYYRRRFGQPAPIVRGKDGALAARLLSRYAMADLDRWLQRFFITLDPFITGSTYGFGVFAACIGKLIAADRPGPVVSPRKIASLEAIHGDE